MPIIVVKPVQNRMGFFGGVSFSADTTVETPDSDNLVVSMVQSIASSSKTAPKPCTTSPLRMSYTFAVGEGHWVVHNCNNFSGLRNIAETLQAMGYSREQHRQIIDVYTGATNGVQSYSVNKRHNANLMTSSTHSQDLNNLVFDWDQLELDLAIKNSGNAVQSNIPTYFWELVTIRDV